MIHGQKNIKFCNKQFLFMSMLSMYAYFVVYVFLFCRLCILIVSLYILIVVYVFSMYS